MKAIPGFPGYYCTTTGRVYSNKSGVMKERKLSLARYGYPKLNLCVNGKKKCKCVHRLMAITFLPDYRQELSVNHIDGNPGNNHISNLEMCTHQENIKHSFRDGLRPRKGEDSPRAILTERDVLEIRDLWKKTYMGQRHLAVLYDVSIAAIGKIVTRKNWSHI